MIEQPILHHHIQKHIVTVLLHTKFARFSELKSPKTDTNLFSYHLSKLLKSGFIEKQDRLYTLSPQGLAYVDRLSTHTGTIRQQPKIISMLLIQNSDGQILLQKRKKQPYIDVWTLPYGKVHIDDETIEIAARREALDKLGLNECAPQHVGDCYIRVRTGADILSSTLVHMFRFYSDEIAESKHIKWVEPRGLTKYPLAPAVEAIVSRCFFGDDYFFDEFDCTWEG